MAICTESILASDVHISSPPASQFYSDHPPSDLLPGLTRTWTPTLSSLGLPGPFIPLFRFMDEKTRREESSL